MDKFLKLLFFLTNFFQGALSLGNISEKELDFEAKLFSAVNFLFNSSYLYLNMYLYYENISIILHTHVFFYREE